MTEAVCKTRNSYTDLVAIGTILHYNSLLSNLLDNPVFSIQSLRTVLSDSPSPLWEAWRIHFTDLSDPKREEHALSFYRSHKKKINTGAKVLWTSAPPFLATTRPFSLWQ